MVAYLVMILNVHLIQPYYLSKYVKSLDMSSSILFFFNMTLQSQKKNYIRTFTIKISGRNFGKEINSRSRLGKKKRQYLI